jgi:hypothetical protein
MLTLDAKVFPTRPTGLTALSLFFACGAVVSLIAAVSLFFPHSFLEPIWRVNARGHENLISLGVWAIFLMLSVSALCLAAAIGLWRQSRWGHWFGVGLIGINLVGDIANALLGTEPRPIIGVPIAAAILLYLLSRKIRVYFRRSDTNGSSLI